MSHITSEQDQDTWSRTDEQQKFYRQTGFRAGLQNTSLANESFTTFAVDDPSSSSFDYRHLTPDQSSEDFHTPELDDLFWPENPPEQGGVEVKNEVAHFGNMSVNSGHPSLRPEASIAFGYDHSLPSPQLTNTSTPEASGHSKRPSQATTFLASPMESPQQLKRPLAFPDSDMSYHGALDSRDTHTTISRTISPMIQISKHTRGDSPARGDHIGPRLNKKRSASNLSTNEFPSHQEDPTSMLMPPQEHFVPEWDEQEPERLGIAPSARDEEHIPSIEDMDHQKKHEDTIQEVESWLERTMIDPDAAARRTAKLQSRSDLARSRSTGMRVRPAMERGFQDNHIPGPGLTVEEQSEYAYSDHASDITSISDYPETGKPDIPPRKPTADLALDEVEPLPSRFFRSGPWQDSFPIHTPTVNERYQPDTSNAAMQKFLRRAKEIDAASRVPTWGTGRRRLSDGEIDSILGDGKATRHLSLSKRTRERMNEVRTKAKDSILKRSNSHQKRHYPHGHELDRVQSPEAIEERSSTDSIGQYPTHAGPSKTKSPSHSTSHAVIAVAGNLAAVGAGSAPLNVDQPRESITKRIIKRVRSGSNVNKSPKNSTGLSELLKGQGGMPVPIIPQHSHENLTAEPVQSPHADRSVSSQPETPIKMDLTPRTTNIIPNLEGFKVQIRELNPRLEPYLVERIAQDQVRRYKRLVKNKVDHVGAVTENRCASGHLCKARGGEAEILPTRNGGRDASANSGQFKIAAPVDSDNEDSNFDGIVSAALFPEGIPLPPAKRLPARFECYLCFQVKTFQKPSDWTKHVHEDVQPFTCTFPQCSDPKSFKRKADWVRHENERHRHLEWWQCNIQECQHKCYRKDNFVQHLVREHKRKEPKVKGRVNTNTKGKGRNVINTFNQEERDFWNLVDSCRKDGANDAKSEPCKFCGNVCTSWKKLSVHVGKHMEQIAMPVLGLAQQRNVNKDTVISPVEPLPSRNHGFTNMDRSMTSEMNANANMTSPYTQSGTSNYQSSSAGQSPAIMHNHVPAQVTEIMTNQPMYLNDPYSAHGLQQGPVSSSAFEMSGSYAHAPVYNPYTTNNPQFGQYVPPGMYPQGQMNVGQDGPRGQTMEGNYMPMQSPHEVQLFASPEMEQHSFTGFHGNNMQGNYMMDTGANHMMQGHLTTPVTTQSMNNEYGYPQSHTQRHGSTGNQYYQH